MKLSILTNVFLLASFVSRSGAQMYAHVERTNLNNNNKCVAKCMQSKRHESVSRVCDQAKQGYLPYTYKACLEGVNNALKQVCEASCDADNAKTLLKKSDFEECKLVQAKYVWCKRGYILAWERLSSFASTIIVEKESAKVEESVRDLDITQQQSDMSNVQSLLEEIDQATEEQCESEVDIEPLDEDRMSSFQTELVPLSTVIVSEESAKIKESVRDLTDVTQQQQCDMSTSTVQELEEICQATEEQLENNKVGIETLSGDWVSSFQTELMPTQERKIASELKHSFESHGIEGSVALIQFERLTSIEAIAGRSHFIDFMPGWGCQHTSGVSNHDTTSKLQTRRIMNEHAVGESNHHDEDCAWDISSPCSTRIRTELADHTWPSRHVLLANSDKGGGAKAIIQATQPADPFQVIDTGPFDRLPPSNAFGEVIWMISRLCVEEPLWLEPSQDTLDIWKRLPVEHKHIEEHSQRRVKSNIALPSLEFISAAEIICSFEPPLNFNLKEIASPITIEVIVRLGVFIDTKSHLRTLKSVISGVNSSKKLICGYRTKGPDDIYFCGVLWILEDAIDLKLVVNRQCSNDTGSNFRARLLLRSKLTDEYHFAKTLGREHAESRRRSSQSITTAQELCGTYSNQILFRYTLVKSQRRVWQIQNRAKSIFTTFLIQVSFSMLMDQVIVILKEAKRQLKSRTENNMSTLLGQIFPAGIGGKGRCFDLLPDGTSVGNYASVDVGAYTKNYLAMVITLLAILFDASTSLFGPSMQLHATKVMTFVFLLCVSISLIGWAYKDRASDGIATQQTAATTNEAVVTSNIFQDPRIPSSVELELSLPSKAAHEDSSNKAMVTIIAVDPLQELSKVNDLTREFDGYSDSMHVDDRYSDSTAMQVYEALTGLDHPGFIAFSRNLLSFDVCSLTDSVSCDLRRLALMLFMLAYHNSDGTANELQDVTLSSGSVISPSTNLNFEEVSDNEVISADGENGGNGVDLSTNIEPSRRKLMALRSELGTHWKSPTSSKRRMRRMRRSPRARSRPKYFEPT